MSQSNGIWSGDRGWSQIPCVYRIQRAAIVATATVPAITPNERTKRQTNCRRSAFMTVGVLTEISVICLLLQCASPATRSDYELRCARRSQLRARLASEITDHWI